MSKNARPIEGHPIDAFAVGGCESPSGRFRCERRNLRCSMAPFHQSPLACAQSPKGSEVIRLRRPPREPLLPIRFTFFFFLLFCLFVFAWEERDALRRRRSFFSRGVYVTDATRRDDARDKENFLAFFFLPSSESELRVYEDNKDRNKRGEICAV